MKKRNLLLLVLGTLLVGALLFSRAWPRREPSYHGKRLSAWLELLNNPPTPAAEVEAATAVRAIGTNALPALIEWIQQDKDPALAKLRSWFRRQCFVELPVAVPDKFVEALCGFRALGLSAEPAVPELSRLLETRNSSEGAAYALGYVGPEGIAVLFRGLTNQKPRTQTYCALALGQSDSPNAVGAVPFLLLQLKHQNKDVRQEAARVLGRLGSQPEIVIPALVQCLGDPDWWVRSMAACSIGKFGQRASNAAPTLEKIMSDANQDSRVHFSAAEALRQIKPPPPSANVPTP